MSMLRVLLWILVVLIAVHVFLATFAYHQAPVYEVWPGMFLAAWLTLTSERVRGWLR